MTAASYVGFCIVQQNDIFIPYLTVRETFQYSAAVRMPPTLSYADRDYCINFVAKTLGLGECMDVLVGDANLKGISGVSLSIWR